MVFLFISLHLASYLLFLVQDPYLVGGSAAGHRQRHLEEQDSTTLVPNATTYSSSKISLNRVASVVSIANSTQGPYGKPIPESAVTGALSSQTARKPASANSRAPSGAASAPLQKLHSYSWTYTGKTQPTGTYARGRTESHSRSPNITYGQPHLPYPQTHEGALHSDCSGTYTIGRITYSTVIVTITEIVGTTTIAYGAPTPSAVYIDPLPFCVTIDECASGVCNSGNIPFQQPYTTVLVTKKTPAISYVPETVGLIFTTPAPAQHIPQHLSIPGLHRTIPSVPPITSSHAISGERPSDIPVISSGGNIGQLPGLLPGSHDLPASGSSPQDGSTPQNSNSRSGDSEYPGQATQPSSNQANQGSNEGGGSNDASTGHPKGIPGIGNILHPGISEPGSGSDNDSPHDTLIPPAVLVNPGTQIINGVPMSIAPDGILLGSHHITPAAGTTTIDLKGKIFTVEPSRIIAKGTTLAFTLAQNQPVRSVTIGTIPVALHSDGVVIASKTYNVAPSPTAIVHKGHTYLLGASELVAAHTTVQFPHARPALGLVTAGGEVFSAYPSQIKAPGITVAIPQNPRPSRFSHRGETFTLNPSQLIVPDRTVGLPLENLITPAPSPITVDGVAMSLYPSAVILGTRTYSFQTPTVVVRNHQTITVGAHGVVMAGSTLAIPLKQEIATITEGSLVFVVNPSQAVIKGHTFLLTQGATPLTTTINGQRITLGPRGVIFAGTTATLPRSTTGSQTVVADGLTFSLNPTYGILSGTTYGIGHGSKPTAIVVGGETVRFGPSGIELPGTTITPPASMTTADGLTFSLESTAIVLSGTTYAYGPGAKPTVITLAGETISIGPEGIGPASTTLMPPSTATVVRAAMTSSSSLSPATPSSLAQEHNDVSSAGTALRRSRQGLFLLLTLGISIWTA